VVTRWPACLWPGQRPNKAGQAGWNNYVDKFISNINIFIYFFLFNNKSDKDLIYTNTVKNKKY
jgi:hypothetical protein